MDILTALKETGKAKGRICGDVHLEDSVLMLSHTKCAVPLEDIFRDDWLPYHPTPEKCDCEAHKRLKAFTKRTGEGPKDNDIAWLLFQVCKQEKP